MEILDNIFVFPVYLVIEFLFNTFYTLTKGNIFLCILIVSFFVNLICLPMYQRAETIQKEEREFQKKLEPVVSKIKRNFKGDERFMLLSTYYRQNHYHPIYSLKTSLSLLIQIPFFSAAYIFFSNLDILKIHSLFGIQNLSMPDNLCSFFGYSINLLPILMTLINILAIQIYSSNASKKDKIQVYSFALIFCAYLTNKMLSPSAVRLSESSSTALLSHSELTTLAVSACGSASATTPSARLRHKDARRRVRVSFAGCRKAGMAEFRDI